MEDAALRFSAIRECACVPYTDKTMGKCLKMFVSMRQGQEFDPMQITAFLEKHLEAYKIPKFIELLPEIPKTYNGKTDRKKLLSITE